jgi:hypothetical protein
MPEKDDPASTQLRPMRTPRARAKVQRPVTLTEHLGSELWVARLGFFGWWQLAVLSGKVNGVPLTFKSHPFRYIDPKEATATNKRPATKTATKTTKNG